MKNKPPLIIIGSTIVLSLLYLSLGHIIVHIISKTYGLNISYNSLRGNACRNLYFTGLKVWDKKEGVGLLSKEAHLKPVFRLLTIKNIFFDLKEVDFLGNKEVSAKAKSGNDPMWFVLTPFKGRWTYKNIKGEISPIKNGIHLKGLTADSADIRLELAGDILYKDNINLAFTVHFSKELIEKWRMSKDLSLYFMNDEKDGGKSISAVFKGSYGSPSIELSSPAFRLNIKPAE